MFKKGEADAELPVQLTNNASCPTESSRGGVTNSVVT